MRDNVTENARLKREFLDAAEISTALNIHRATLRRWVRRGQFPAPILLTPTHPAWPIATYRAWRDEREAASARREVA